MKPMTYKELGEKVAEQALDDYLINGKTMREWINILSDNMSVLDKIRAEIKQLPYQRIFGNVSSYSLLDAVIEIIDKYRESEDET